GVAVGVRQAGELGDRGRFADRYPLGVLRGADARGQRVTRVERQVHHAAALHAILRAPRTLGIDCALRVAVFARVGIDDAPHGAVLGRDLGLDAAPRAEVPRDDDGTLHRDAHPLEPLV